MRCFAVTQKNKLNLHFDLSKDQRIAQNTNVFTPVYSFFYFYMHVRVSIELELKLTLFSLQVKTTGDISDHTPIYLHGKKPGTQGDNKLPNEARFLMIDYT